MSRAWTWGMTMPELHGDVAPQGLDPVEQVAAALRVDEVDELHAELELERHHAHLLGGQRLGASAAGAAGAGSGFSDVGGEVFGQAGPPSTNSAAPTRRKGSLGRPGTKAEPEHDHAGRLHNAPVAGELGEHVVPRSSSVAARVTMMPVESEIRKRRDLGDEPVADGEQAVGADGLGERDVVLEDADGQAAEQVDRR